MIIKKGTLG